MKKMLSKTIQIVLLTLIVLSLGACHKTKSHRKQANNIQLTYDGIDVSHYQNTIDWNVVAKDKNLQYVYIKATEGSTMVDSQYQYNHDNAVQSRIKVGAYHFLQTTSSAHSQFEHFKRIVPKNSIDLIPMVDVEIDEHKSKWSHAQVQDSLQVFMNLCKEYYGKYPMIYGTQRSYNTWCAPRFNQYQLYIGRYGAKPPVINGEGSYTIWQYSESGRISGITGNVDLSCFGNGHSIEDILLSSDK